jgi:hypothetical protein
MRSGSSWYMMSATASLGRVIIDIQGLKSKRALVVYVGRTETNQNHRDVPRRQARTVSVSTLKNMIRKTDICVAYYSRHSRQDSRPLAGQERDQECVRIGISEAFVLPFTRAFTRGHTYRREREEIMLGLNISQMPPLPLFFRESGSNMRNATLHDHRALTGHH